MHRIALAVLLLGSAMPMRAADAAYFEFFFRSTDNTSLGPPFVGSALDMVGGVVEWDGSTIQFLYVVSSDRLGLATGLVPAGAGFQPTDNLLFETEPQLTPQGFALAFFGGGVQMRLSYNPVFGLYEQRICTDTGDCTATLGEFYASGAECISCNGIPEPGAASVLAVALGGLAAAAWAAGRNGRAAA